MKNYELKKLNRLLASGLGLILAGFILLVLLADNQGVSLISSIWPIFVLAAGAVCLYFSIALTFSGFQFYIGLVMSASGTFFTLVVNNIIHGSMAVWWPFIVIFSGTSLIAASFFKRHKLTMPYVISSVALMLLGGMFLLFSFKVMPISFRTFSFIFLPIALITGGVMLVVVFFIQRKYGKLTLEQEEIDNFQE